MGWTKKKTRTSITAYIRSNILHRAADDGWSHSPGTRNNYDWSSKLFWIGFFFCRSLKNIVYTRIAVSRSITPTGPQGQHSTTTLTDLTAATHPSTVRTKAATYTYFSSSRVTVRGQTRRLPCIPLFPPNFGYPPPVSSRCWGAGNRSVRNVVHQVSPYTAAAVVS